MSFSLIPPEINSALMFSGAGSGPLLEAATAWNALSADLESTATQYQTLITNLTTGPWLGPSAARMAAATAPYIAWLQGTAATAAQTGSQAQVAATAYQSAYSSMVPLPEIAANRALLAQLVANNFLGQNTGAIATTEANYLDMWIQDALVMDTYQLNSKAASTLPAQTAAPQVASGALPAAATAAGAVPADATSSVLIQLLLDVADLFGYTGTAGPATLGAGDIASWLGLVATGVATNPSAALLPVQASYYMGMLASTPARMFMSSGSSGGSGGVSGSTLASMGDSLLENVGKFIDGKLVAVTAGVGNQLQSWGSSVAAQLAGAQHLGGLSVPNAWHGMAPEMARAAPLMPDTSVAAPSMTAGLPSSPFAQGLMGALAGRGVSGLGSRVAAKVMPRSPAGG
ncbi:MAG: PPE family protein [Mycobacterium sp.]|uniref:PPE family protein n=1 Tax=Mycobacterium sp. TaxID=1785 RepID=UPI003C463CBE